jgi:hypothetical protein
LLKCENHFGGGAERITAEIERDSAGEAGAAVPVTVTVNRMASLMAVTTRTGRF